MPLYRYQALTMEGKGIDGLIEADSLSVAKERLKIRKVLVVAVKEEKHKGRVFVFKAETRLSFTRELAQLLRAGLPLYESLITIEEKSRKEKHHRLLIDLIDRLKQGESLSSALKNYPKAFDEVYLSMVAAAEESGTLQEAFSELSSYLEKQAKWKKQILSITTYPLFLMLFSLFIFCALLFFLIPSMQELYEGRALHPLTQAVLSLSNFSRENISWIAGLMGCLVIGSVLASKEKKLRNTISQMILRCPFVKDVIMQAAMARFSRASSLLLKSGVPLLETLKLSRPTLKHSVFERALSNAETKILEGRSLHAELKESGYFPSLVVRLIAIAEETGKMKEAFINIAEIYDEELAKSLEKLTTVLQPALLLLLGLIVGVMVLAVLLPLTDVSSFLS